MKTETPKAIDPAPALADLILHVLGLSHSSNSLLIVCKSREAFLADLQASIRQSQTNAQFERHPLHSRTLQLLATSQRVQLAFCSSVPALRAYLAAFPLRSANHNQFLRFVLLDSASLHRDASYFSAQELGQTLAAAVEAAYEGSVELVVVECARVSPESILGVAGDGSVAQVGVEQVEAQNVGRERAETVPAEEENSESPWEKRVPIVASSTRAFGTGGDRSWMQKSVKVKDVVERWCVFERLSEW